MWEEHPETNLDIDKAKSKADQEEYYYVRSTDKVMTRIEEDGGLLGTFKSSPYYSEFCHQMIFGRDTFPRSLKPWRPFWPYRASGSTSSPSSVDRLIFPSNFLTKTLFSRGTTKSSRPRCRESPKTETASELLTSKDF